MYTRNTNANKSYAKSGRTRFAFTRSPTGSSFTANSVRNTQVRDLIDGHIVRRNIFYSSNPLHEIISPVSPHETLELVPLTQEQIMSLDIRKPLHIAENHVMRKLTVLFDVRPGASAINGHPHTVLLRWTLD